MKQIFTLLCALLCTGLTYGQVPGYMGKRAWISADVNFAPAFFNMNKNHMVAIDITDEARAKGENLLALNYRPQFTFEYLLGRDVALGLSYSILQTGTVKKLDHPDPEIAGPHYDILKGSAFGLHMKKFKFQKSASIAPIGYYWTMGITAAKFNTYNSNKSKIGQFSKDVLNPVLSMGGGKQKVLFDRLIVNSGVEFGWSFMPKDLMDEDTSNQTHPYSESIHHAFNSMLGYYIFNMKLSVGYLAF